MRAALETILGPIEQIQMVRRGYAHNERAVATLSDGRSVFVKRAVDDMTAGWLRQEHRMYEALRVETFVPEVILWVDGDLPVLVLEDLSGATWPPPWSPDRVDAVLSTLNSLAGVQAPDGLPRLPIGEQAEEGWKRVLAQPSEFLSLELCDEAWLDDAGPDLRAAAAAAPLAGEGLLHLDVRSDNICFRREKTLLVDWNLAGIGNPQVDVAFWLPSLAAEGGPSPETVMPDCPPELVAYVCGFFAWRAGQAELPHAPLVRHVQRQQLRTALPWVARALNLRPPLPVLRGHEERG